jgi:hypothetical protein
MSIDHDRRQTTIRFELGDRFVSWLPCCPRLEEVIGDVDGNDDITEYFCTDPQVYRSECTL